MQMEKHIQVLGILHIIYSSFGVLIGALVCLLFFGLGTFVGSIPDVPPPASEGVPAILLVIGLVIAALVFLFSVPGIIAGVGLLKRKEWGRILALIVGFFDLLHIPLGTALGVYTIWALMNDETIKLFRNQVVQ
jgi:hypothetical protein